MSSWAEFESAEPEFAGRVRRIFESGRHKTIATLRRDGGPRISGIECQFSADQLTIGTTPGTVMEADLGRDPRLAIHGPSPDPPEDDPSAWHGDAKIAGRAIQLAEPVQPEPPARWFRVDIEEVVVTSVGTPADHLVIESWHPGRGLERRRRE